MNTPLATAAPNRHILIVDDLPSIHEDFRKILAPAPVADKLRDLEAAVFGMAVAPALPGFQLDSAFQGQQAIAMVEAAVRAGRPYALAFVDMLMPPGLDGVETIERLWRIDPDIQVVICTAYSDHPWDPVLRRLDLQDRLLVIKKPCDAVEVSQLARALTARWTIARQAAEHIATLERAVQSLTAREAELRQSKAEADAFAHSVSQHLRSPLMAMSALGNLLAKELQRHDDESALRHLSRIRTNAEFGKRVIDGLLGLARIGQAQLSMEPLDLSEIASAMLAEVCRASAGPTVSIAVQAGLRALGDRRLIQAAMRELVGNACKFSARKPQPVIEVGGYEGAGNESVFYVRDNGEGFDMAHASRLFRTFQRLHPSDEFAGTGLGLVTAARIIERHHGRIWADAKPGQGATIYFTLPAIAAVEPAAVRLADTGQSG